jgi:glutathione synthase
VTNDPDAIAITNEKLISYLSKDAVESYVGSSLNGFLEFCQNMINEGHQFIVLKPLDLYQGIGVEKLDLNSDLEMVFKERTKQFGGAIVVQPYLKAVESGEVRSVYFKGKHLGSILKTPKKGEFISNIAHGASYQSYQLTKDEEELCRKDAELLDGEGLPWVAFDLLGGKIQEMNITCPGLLVEVSKANGKNLAYDLIDLLD